MKSFFLLHAALVVAHAAAEMRPVSELIQVTKARPSTLTAQPSTPHDTGAEPSADEVHTYTGPAHMSPAETYGPGFMSRNLLSCSVYNTFTCSSYDSCRCFCPGLVCQYASVPSSCNGYNCGGGSGGGSTNSADDADDDGFYAGGLNGDTSGCTQDCEEADIELEMCGATASYWEDHMDDSERLDSADCEKVPYLNDGLQAAWEAGDVTMSGSQGTQPKDWHFYLQCNDDGTAVAAVLCLHSNCDPNDCFLMSDGDEYHLTGECVSSGIDSLYYQLRCVDGLTPLQLGLAIGGGVVALALFAYFVRKHQEKQGSRNPSQVAKSIAPPAGATATALAQPAPGLNPMRA